MKPDLSPAECVRLLRAALPPIERLPALIQCGPWHAVAGELSETECVARLARHLQEHAPQRMGVVELLSRRAYRVHRTRIALDEAGWPIWRVYRASAHRTYEAAADAAGAPNVWINPFRSRLERLEGADAGMVLDARERRRK